MPVSNRATVTRKTSLPARRRRVLPPRLRGAAFYQVHDNGGRPFTVLVDRSASGGARVRLYRTRTHPAPPGEFPREFDVAAYRRDPPRPAELKATWEAVERVWVGRHAGLYLSARESLGNSLLLRLPPKRGARGAHRYVHVGSPVVEFETGDPIRAFESPVGNNDVPYPVALSASEVFFLAELVRLPRAATRLAKRRDPATNSRFWETVYTDLYGTPEQVEAWCARKPDAQHNPAAKRLEGRRIVARP